MPATFDAAASGPETGAATTLTWSHTCTGSNLVLLVFVYFQAGNAASSVTYNGVAMTSLVNVFDGGATGYLQCYYLLNPAIGAHNVVATWSDSVVRHGFSVSAINALQSAPTVVTNSNAFSNPTTVTITGAGTDLFIDGVGVNALVAFTPGSGQTGVAGSGSSAYTIGGSYKTGAASVAMTEAMGGSNPWAAIGVRVQQAPAGPAMPVLVDQFRSRWS